MTTDAPPVVTKKKLIEVALPLDAINKASKREKSIRHGHPSTLHLWWSRKPLATARAVIFAQMVDDPSANPDLFPTERAQERERQRLFGIIEELVQWENTTNEAVLEQAREEIWQSWRRACAENADHPHAKELFDRHVLPAFHDPFAGGGSLPLEAQRLGLEAHASDLNPVAVLINKAMIEIPPKFAGRPPVNPEAQSEDRLMDQTWRGAQGLSEDVRYYGRWMRDEAEKRVGHLYPQVRVTEEMAEGRPDLEPYIGQDLTVIAWLWARTVRSPNPAFADVDVPLTSKFVLSQKKGKEAYVEPVIEDGNYRFTVKLGSPPEAARQGTKLARGANFRCVMSGTPIAGDYIKAEGRAGRIGARLVAIVAEGNRGRVYVAPTSEHSRFADDSISAAWKPTTELVGKCGDQLPLYGMRTFGDLFTDRQLVALNAFSDLVSEARERVREHASSTDLEDDQVPLREGGLGAAAYADAVGAYLGIVVSRQTNRSTTLNVWNIGRETIEQVFATQALRMMWDFAEGNVFSSSSGNFLTQVEYLANVLDVSVPASIHGTARQLDARVPQTRSGKVVVSTDPPYYNNIAYADLSDFFYIWLRRSLRDLFPELFSTMASPKSEEILASPYRHVDREHAEIFFLDGMEQALRRILDQAHPAFPVTVYYALKQSETRTGGGVASTGWETFLDAVIRAGFSIAGTWPVRTERPTGIKVAVNALASSIALVCRPRSTDAPSSTRRELQEALRAEFPRALSDLQRSNIAPVDLAQASIGPGMAVFTRYRQVLNADGSQMSVGDALALINATLDEVLAEQEGDFDADSRWALTWFEQHGYAEGEYGVAEQLSKAKNTSVGGLVRAGIVESRRGNVRILKPDELDPEWDPSTDSRLTLWEMTQHLIRSLSTSEQAAAELASKLGSQAEAARDLAYRLYVVSERKRRAADALAYNGLVQSWPEIVRIAGEQRATAAQGALAIDGA